MPLFNWWQATITLEIFYWIYLLVIVIYCLFSFFNLYHLVRFGFFSFLNVSVIIIFIGVSWGLIAYSLLVLSGFDWSPVIFDTSWLFNFGSLLTSPFKIPVNGLKF
jgi:hypothetical protein